MDAGNGWFDADSFLALKEYVRASENSMRENFRKLLAFTKEFHEQYNRLVAEARAESKRWVAFLSKTGDAIIQRSIKLLAKCMRFEACVRSVRLACPTENSIGADVDRSATVILNIRVAVKKMCNYMVQTPSNTDCLFPFALQLA